MLELATIFLLTLVLSAFTIWLYRSLSGWRDYSDNLLRAQSKPNGMKIARQNGFVTLFSTPREKARNIRLRTNSKNIKAPWGW